MFRILLSLFAVSALTVAGPAWAQSDPTQTQEAAAVETFVNRAADLIEAKGKAAFAEFRKPGSSWRQGELYLFVSDVEGTVLFHGVDPSREGKNWLEERDADGRQFHKDFAQTVETSGAGWVDYMFPKPGERVPSEKWSYVCAVTIDGIVGLVGAGLYIDNGKGSRTTAQARQGR